MRIKFSEENVTKLNKSLPVIMYQDVSVLLPNLNVVLRIKTMCPYQTT